MGGGIAGVGGDPGQGGAEGAVNGEEVAGAVEGEAPNGRRRPDWARCYLVAFQVVTSSPEQLLGCRHSASTKKPSLCSIGAILIEHSSADHTYAAIGAYVKRNSVIGNLKS